MDHGLECSHGQSHSRAGQLSFHSVGSLCLSACVCLCPAQESKREQQEKEGAKEGRKEEEKTDTGKLGAQVHPDNNNE